MVLPVCPFKPFTNSDFEEGKSVIGVELDGGSPRLRADYVGAWGTIDVSWVLDGFKFQVFEAFYHNQTLKGASNFEMLLMTDGSEMVTHECQFVPGTKRAKTIGGTARMVTATLRVKPIDRNEDMDEALLMLYENYGNNASNFLNALEQLVNVDMPNSIG